jgi:hypothetical protein
MNDDRTETSYMSRPKVRKKSTCVTHKRSYEEEAVYVLGCRTLKLVRS